MKTKTKKQSYVNQVHVEHIFVFNILENYCLIKKNKNTKKLFFSALACVAFASSAFASNEVIVENENVETNATGRSTFEIQSVNYEFGFCSITIIYHYILPGGQTYSETKTIMLGYTQNAAQCQQLQRDYVNKVLLPSLQPGDKVW